MLLSTRRLELRRFCAEDAAVFAAYRSDPEVARYQSWDAPVSLPEASALVAEFGAGDPRSPGWFQYAVELRADSALIGDVGVNLHDNRMQAEIGFSIAPAYQGRGYATEAVLCVLDHLFAVEGLRRVSAECDARNLRLPGCSSASALAKRGTGWPTPGSGASGPTISCSVCLPRIGEAAAVAWSRLAPMSATAKHQRRAAVRPAIGSPSDEMASGRPAPSHGAPPTSDAPGHVLVDDRRKPVSHSWLLRRLEAGYWEPIWPEAHRGSGAQPEPLGGDA